ncbi:MAG: hypothetical protein OEY29_10185 [Gammaproteobacteria bacterium]|nr:hypothetical protein [Gammaproteobacteria bacterium]
MKNIVIIGQGQLGLEVTRQHLQSNDMIYSVSRSHRPSLSASHHSLSTDLDTLRSAIALPLTIDCLYYFAPPSETEQTDQRMHTFLSLHQRLSIDHIIYISTSGVYGDSQGQWLTELSAVKPQALRAKRRLDAEHQLSRFCQTRSSKLTILRCAAIYSSKTVSRQRIHDNNKPLINASQAPYTNRIHLHDLTHVCLQAMLNPPVDKEIYNVSDGQPSTTTEHAWLLADLAGLERNTEIDLADAGQYYSPAYLSYLAESKRLDISKLKNSLLAGFTFKNTAEGIKECLQQSV